MYARAFGHHGDPPARSLPCHRALHSLRQLIPANDVYPGECTLLVRQLRRIEVQIASRRAVGTQLHLGLPLVDVRVCLRKDALKPVLRTEVDELLVCLSVFVGTEAFRAL